jgi:putative Holliday junction resolvase
VIGLPISLSGSLGPQAQAVKAFGQELSARLPLPIEYWDERLSTVEAQRRLASAGHRGPKAKARLDALAAAIVLQGYLDRQAQASPSPFES